MKGLLSDAEIADALEEGRALAVRACGTCRHHQSEDARFMKCRAIGSYCSIERGRFGLCGPEAKFWETQPKRTRGVFERAWTFLFGASRP